MSLGSRSGVGVIGVACTFPGARDAAQFWQNIVEGVDAITDVTPDRWDPEIFFDPNPDTPDRIYCRKGGWIGGTYRFNPLQFGIMPSALEGTEADHFLVLRAAAEALRDAGYQDRALNGDRVNIILGKGNYTGPGVTALMYRSIVTEQVLAILKGLHPEFSEGEITRLKTAIRSTLPPLTPEGAAGLIPNICTGRVANRLGFMGRNFTVDAACASSLIATEIACNDLLSGAADMVFAGGVHIFSHIPFLQVFDTMRALSLGSKIRPYDDRCDGTIPGEGVGMLVLKRLEDAERDGDRIYAVIKGTGSSSDGRAKGVVAPRTEGEELAIRRALEAADFPPHTISLVEGHGTGTAAGDAAEAECLRRVFGAGDSRPGIALGSVKSMIGHAMPASGAASLIKTVLALHHRVLPPTLNCEQPRADLKGTPIYINGSTRPWIHPAGAPRRAGVSAFGFGGINAHIALEEYRPRAASPVSTLQRRWPVEFVTVEADSRLELVAKCSELQRYLRSAGGIDLCSVAYSTNTNLRSGHERLTLVAASLGELDERLEKAKIRLAEAGAIRDRQGIYSFADGELNDGKIAILFPGEGSQYVGMLSDVCIHFPEVREAFDLADAANRNPSRRPASSLIFPPQPQSEQDAQQAEAELFTIERATEAVLTSDAAVARLLETLRLQPHMMAGHSAGEWIALAAAGVLDSEEFLSSMGRLAAMHERIASDEAIPSRTMLAVAASREKVESLAREIQREIVVANDNCTRQVVVVVEKTDEEAVVAQFAGKGLLVEKLPYDRGYHTPAFTYISAPLRQYFASLTVSTPKIELYSCTTAEPYPAGRDQILDLVSETFVRPLLFRQTIEAMYANGARIFVEAGPRGNLTAFVDDILRGRPHLAVSIDQLRRPGLVTLNHALAMLVAAGVELDLRSLYERRGARRLTFDALKDALTTEGQEPGSVEISICYPRLGVPEPLSPHPTVTVQSVPLVHDHSGMSALEPSMAPYQDTSSFQTNGSDPFGAIDPHRRAILGEHVAIMDELIRTHEAVMLGSLGSEFRPTSEEKSQPWPAVADNPEPSPSSSGSQMTVLIPSTPPESAISEVRSIEEALLRIVEARTGYPKDMLGLDLDLEADLGIDSIKRVEILSELQQTGTAAGWAAQVDMEQVTGLKTLRQVVAFIEKAIASLSAASDRTASDGLQVGPMLRGCRILDHIPGRSLRLTVTLTLSEHVFLRDHRLYFDTSDHGNQGRSILSMPMTGSLELMCEAASMLRPGLLVVGAESVQATKWINVDETIGRTELAVSAAIQEDGMVRVAIWPESVTGQQEPKPSEILAEARIVFEKNYLQPPIAEPFQSEALRPPVFPERTVYSEHLMFHGPRFQGIDRIEGTTTDGVLGKLTVLPSQDCLSSESDPQFHIDPFLLDAAGQLVGYWPVEYLQEGNIALPIRIGKIQVFQRKPPTGAPLECRVRIREVTRRQLRGDFDVVLADGTVWMRVNSWEDWRFYWEKHIHEFWRFPKRNLNGRAVHLPEGLRRLGFVCQRIDPMSEMDKTGLWELLWMQMILDREELSEYQALAHSPSRVKWIFERAAAKDAARRWWIDQLGGPFAPADIRLSVLGGSRFQASGHWDGQAPTPYLAAASSGGFGVGIAGVTPVRIAVEQGGMSKASTPEEFAHRVTPVMFGPSTRIRHWDAANGIAFVQTPEPFAIHCFSHETLAIAVGIQEDSAWIQ